MKDQPIRADNERQDRTGYSSRMGTPVPPADEIRKVEHKLAGFDITTHWTAAARLMVI